MRDSQYPIGEFEAPEGLKRELVHPDSGPVQLATNVGIYAWHGRHHLAHVRNLARRRGWIG